METNRVALATTVPCYNSEPPFHPHIVYPELPIREVSRVSNYPYALFRRLLLQLGFDKDNFGTSTWNPLATIIKPGETVLVKPNFVLHFNRKGDLYAVVTHPSILRAIIDYVYKALKGNGRIIIADAPQMDCNWQQLLEELQLESIRELYSLKFNFQIDILDLRNFEVIDATKPAYSVNRRTLPGDPLGSVVINLGEQSLFFGFPNANYYGADYNRNETISHHRDPIHEYCISKTVLSSDVFISVPKMKVHKKVGVTLNMKGLVGINTNKNYLIHYRLGSPKNGGDQLPDSQPRYDKFVIKAQRWIFDRTLAKQSAFYESLYEMALKAYRLFISPLHSCSADTFVKDAGNWYGNDSAWRMTIDLARIILYADSKGVLHDTPQRKLFSVIDGIIGGENNGPLEPDRKDAGSLVVGTDIILVDLVATILMGFDFRRIKQFSAIFDSDYFSVMANICDSQVYFNDRVVTAKILLDSGHHVPSLKFRPHPGWEGKIELQ